MTLATTQISRLMAQTSTISSVSLASPGMSSRNAQSSSQIHQTTLPVGEREFDQSRIEAMETLASILKRNTRVRYEIDVVEVINAYVSYQVCMSYPLADGPRWVESPHA